MQLLITRNSSVSVNFRRSLLLAATCHVYLGDVHERLFVNQPLDPDDIERLTTPSSADEPAFDGRRRHIPVGRLLSCVEPEPWYIVEG